MIIEQGGRGGIADYTGRLAEALCARGLLVSIATATDHLYHLPDAVEVLGVFTYVRSTSPAGRLVRRAGLGRVANGLLFLAALPRLVRLARRRAVVHVQGFERTELGVLAMVALDVTGARIVYTAHNTFKRSRWTLDATRVLPRLACATIVHTEADRRRIGRQVVTRIPHGHYGAIADGAPHVDPAAARAAFGLPEEVPIVLLFGVLRPDKGLGDLLEALASTPGWRLLIAGEEHGALAAAAEQLRDPRLSERVRVCQGFLPLAEVARCFAAADVLALPYRQASQSGALHLAYGFARPVIAYPVGGFLESVLDGETGWLCADATPAALADTLAEAAAAGHAELRRRGARARSWSQEQFGWDRIAAATEAVYDAVLARARGPEWARHGGGGGR
jgi:glycosyltransferase involved in cell wall biosynthesis